MISEEQSFLQALRKELDELKARIANLEVSEPPDKKAPQAVQIYLSNGVNYITTSTTFVDVDSTNLVIRLNTNYENIFLWCNLVVFAYYSTFITFNVDGNDLGTVDGLTVGWGTVNFPISLSYLVKLTPGNHTFKLRYKTAPNNHAGIYCNSNLYVPIIFGAKEIG